MDRASRRRVPKSQGDITFAGGASGQIDQLALIGRFIVVHADPVGCADLVTRLSEVRPVDRVESVEQVQATLAGPYPRIGLVVDLPHGHGVRALENLIADAMPILLVAPQTRRQLDHASLPASSRVRVILRSTVSARPQRFGRLIDGFVEDALDHEQRTVGVWASLFDLSDGDLTRAEMRVAELVVADFTRKEVAEELGVSEKTVANHMTQILAKCGGTGKRAHWLRQRVNAKSRPRRHSPIR